MPSSLRLGCSGACKRHPKSFAMDHSGELGRILLGIQNDPKSASPVLDDVKALLQVLGTSAAEESGKRHRDARFPMSNVRIRAVAH